MVPCHLRLNSVRSEKAARPEKRAAPTKPATKIVRCFRSGRCLPRFSGRIGHLRFAVTAPESGIHRLEENHSIFEFVFPFHLREDGSGEKGFECLNQNLIFHVEREHPVIPSEVNL
jgi:hypothetical protein